MDRRSHNIQLVGIAGSSGNVDHAVASPLSNMDGTVTLGPIVRVEAALHLHLFCFSGRNHVTHFSHFIIWTR